MGAQNGVRRLKITLITASFLIILLSSFLPPCTADNFDVSK